MAECECGCGQDAGLYATTAKGHRKGEPKRYVNGHNGKHAGRPFTPLDERYTVEDRGHETPCWIWQMTLSRKGYGRMWDPATGKIVSAARWFYERFVGPIPEGLHIDHLCRVRACVNPAHLEPVTNLENQRRGVRARIPDEQIEQTRALLATGVSLNAVSKAAGLSHPTITAIARGTYWR